MRRKNAAYYLCRACFCIDIQGTGDFLCMGKRVKAIELKRISNITTPSYIVSGKSASLGYLSIFHVCNPTLEIFFADCRLAWRRDNDFLRVAF